MQGLVQIDAHETLIASNLIIMLRKCQMIQNLDTIIQYKQQDHHATNSDGYEGKVSVTAILDTACSTTALNKGQEEVLLYFRNKGNESSSDEPSSVVATILSEPSAASSSVTSSVSTGKLPRNVSFSFSAIDFPPPVEKILLISPQHGHTYPLMFSTTPKTGRETVRVNERHFMASARATACGVVTMMEDKRECTGARCSRRDRCSSDVPMRI